LGVPTPRSTRLDGGPAAKDAAGRAEIEPNTIEVEAF
jgi:hypothetical protein